MSPAENGYPSMDYMEMVDIILENVETSEYIDLFGALKAGDYYRTDSHWRQESIIPVAQALCAAMGAAAPDEKDFVSAYIGDFQGVYSGLSGLSAEDDEMLVLESEATKSAIVTSAELEGALPVYAPEKFSGKEPYDVFLHGAQAVLTIENPDAAEKKELIIFRDSFGSSLAPLLIGSYSKITLVDLRYIMGDYVSELWLLRVRTSVYLQHHLLNPAESCDKTAKDLSFKLRSFLCVLFDGYGFCEVSGLVDVAASVKRDIIGKELQWQHRKAGQQNIVGIGNRDDFVRCLLHPFP